MARSFDEYMSNLTTMWNLLGQYEIEIGVISKNSSRTSAKLGLTNAELMYIHENGSPMRNIPARPVLAIALKHASKKMLPETLKVIEKGLFDYGWERKDVEDELEKFCLRLQDYAQQIIGNNDGRLAPNAPSTIKAKGMNHPLQVTGQLKRSITCHLIKKL